MNMRDEENGTGHATYLREGFETRIALKHEIGESSWSFWASWSFR